MTFILPRFSRFSLQILPPDSPRRADKMRTRKRPNTLPEGVIRNVIMDLDSSDSSPEALAFNRWGEKKKRLSKSKPQKRPQKEDGRSAKRPKSEFKDTLVLPFTSLALGERCGYEDSDVLIPDTNSTDEWTKGLEFAGEDVCRDTPNEWELDKTECTTVPTASLGTHSNWSKTMVAQIGELQVGIRNITIHGQVLGNHNLRLNLTYNQEGLSWLAIGFAREVRGAERDLTGILRLSVVTHSEEEKRAIDLVELNIIIKARTSEIRCAKNLSNVHAPYLCSLEARITSGDPLSSLTVLEESESPFSHPSSFLRPIHSHRYGRSYVLVNLTEQVASWCDKRIMVLVTEILHAGGAEKNSSLPTTVKLADLSGESELCLWKEQGKLAGNFICGNTILNIYNPRYSIFRSVPQLGIGPCTLIEQDPLSDDTEIFRTLMCVKYATPENSSPSET